MATTRTTMAWASTALKGSVALDTSGNSAITKKRSKPRRCCAEKHVDQQLFDFAQSWALLFAADYGKPVSATQVTALAEAFQSAFEGWATDVEATWEQPSGQDTP